MNFIIDTDGYDNPTIWLDEGRSPQPILTRNNLYASGLSGLPDQDHPAAVALWDLIVAAVERERPHIYIWSPHWRGMQRFGESSCDPDVWTWALSFPRQGQDVSNGLGQLSRRGVGRLAGSFRNPSWRVMKGPTLREQWYAAERTPRIALLVSSLGWFIACRPEQSRFCYSETRPTHAEAFAAALAHANTHQTRAADIAADRTDNES